MGVENGCRRNSSTLMLWLNSASINRFNLKGRAGACCSILEMIKVEWVLMKSLTLSQDSLLSGVNSRALQVFLWRMPLVMLKFGDMVLGLLLLLLLLGFTAKWGLFIDAEEAREWRYSRGIACWYRSGSTDWRNEVAAAVETMAAVGSTLVEGCCCWEGTVEKYKVLLLSLMLLVNDKNMNLQFAQARADCRRRSAQRGSVCNFRRAAGLSFFARNTVNETKYMLILSNIQCNNCNLQSFMKRFFRWRKGPAFLWSRSS